MSPHSVIHAIAAVVIVGQVLVVIYLVTLPGRRSWAKKLHDWFGSWALPGAFLVAALSMTGSLYFSEVAKIVPCELCWFQRILMYPQVLLLGLALLKKNRDIFYQSITLSVIGLGFSIYHYYLQRGGNPLIPCSTVGFSVSCSQNFTLDFGYITIPLMAMTGFVMIIVAMLLFLQRTNQTTEV